VAAYYAVTTTQVALPNHYTSILSLDLPAGNWYVDGFVSVVNLSSQRVPVGCQIASEFNSVADGTVLAAAPEGAATLPVGAVVQGGRRIDLECSSNSGDPAITATAGGRQLTAIRVDNVITQHPASP
jgi:hypothetical protein